MLTYYIITFIVGAIIGALITFIYSEVTDKLKLAKAGYGIGKGILYYIIRKFKKS